MIEEQTPDMKEISRSIRKLVIQAAYRAHVGHIGSALSVADLITALYFGTLKIPSQRHPSRERFVLSKGHAALALYAAFLLKGWINEDELASYCTDGTLLGVHPERELPGVDFSTGSLGMGLSYGAGAALAARLEGSPRRTFVLLSDGECNEGSVWEAVMFAAHRRLSSLVALVDINGQQALGYTRDVIDLTSMRGRWESFGWDVNEVDGHDPARVAGVIQSLDVLGGPPHVLLCRTTFGKGVSFMENQIRWHYLPLSDSEYHMALEEISRV